MSQATTRKTDPISLDSRRIRVDYDGPLAISVGKSRFETNWKNQRMTWGSLLHKLSESRDTGETHAEYMKWTKDKQDTVKDIGGFVGGHLTEGHRKSGSVASRQIITLDADNAPEGLWERLLDMTLDTLPCAMAIYSTHKHTPTAPRLRVILPLDREVSADEYEAIARKVAEHIGIDWFDDSTYQPARLMYWPSHSHDVEPVFEYFDAPFLKADKVLDEYPDWSDASYWPESSRMTGIRKKQADRQGDPLEKRNIVGIFCRTYSVTEAIAKFLPDVYAPTDKENRYTYLAGSTAAGLVIYDGDVFAYSNHGTDPASQQLCNAFDLVRIHKFGDLDEGVEDKPMNRRESWKAMAELMLQDPACQRTRDADAADEFAGEPVEEEWRQKLIRNENLTLKAALVNATLILENDEALQGIRLNEMTERIEATDLPWKEGKVGWSDYHDSCLLNWIARKYGVEFSAAKLRDALRAVSYDRQYNPIRDYLDSLPAWDGVERLDTLLVKYLDAPDTLYTREATRKTLVAAVARIYEPGIKFDIMLVLVGPQGAGKSTFFQKLVRGHSEWFSDSLRMDAMDSTKESGEQIQGKWIVEIGEMTGMRKADINAVKGFTSRQVDSFRNAYGHYSEDRPRRCIVVGSTNQEEGFLRDTTGNRRFWPVMIRKGETVKSLGITYDEVDQFWAEAKILYETGEELILSQEAELMAEEAQREAMEQDERQGLVEEYLDRLLPENWDSLDSDMRQMFLDSDDPGTVTRQTVSNIEIWVEALRKPANAIRPQDSYEIAKMMAKIPGWAKTNERKRLSQYGRQRVYRRTG